jgi:tRNA(fMet)-specific endonuclease VapC
MIVLDTDHLSELQRPQSRRRVRLVERLELHADRVSATTIVSVEEQFRGRLATINSRPAGIEQVTPYLELNELLRFFIGWIVLRFDPTAVGLYQGLRASKVRVGTMELKIAAIVLAHNGTLLSANLRDFRQVPNLPVEDWLSEE